MTRVSFETPVKKHSKFVIVNNVSVKKISQVLTTNFRSKYGYYGLFTQPKNHKETLLPYFDVLCWIDGSSFWAIRGSYDLFWWGVNLWLILLSLWALGYKLFRNDE